MEREVTCCFTGHRPNKLPWQSDEADPRCIALKADIQAALETAYDEGYRHFICGMALGCDLYFGEAVIELRKAHPDVTLEAAVPCEEQPDRWSEEEQTRYRQLLELCDFETMVQHHYTKGCMLRRNRYMVDRSSLLIAAYDGTAGGTMYTVSYAMKQGIAIRGLEVNGFRFT